MAPVMVLGRTALLVFAAAALTACQSDKALRVDFSETPRAYVAKDYRDVYDRWTRHDFVMHDVEKALEVWATFKSWDFREAYVEHYASVYSLPDAERATLRNAQRDSLHKAYEFHVTAQSAVPTRHKMDCLAAHCRWPGRCGSICHLTNRATAPGTPRYFPSDE